MPLTVSVTVVAPVQIASVGVTDTEGTGRTVNTEVALLVHPLPSVPVTVYVVLLVGVAFTDAPVLELSVADGDQL